MIKRNILLVLGLVLAWGVSPVANAASLKLDTFTDQTTGTINLPATKLLMASVGTSVQGGGGASDATSTTVTIGGGGSPVVAADIAQVCVDYNTVEVACVTDPASLTSIVITLTGTHDADAPFDFRVTLNPSAAGKTIFLTVDGFTASGALADAIPLPQSTATRNIAGGASAPTLDASTLQSLAAVTSSSATLEGNILNDGGDPPITSRGTVWNTTGAPITENALAEGGVTTGGFFDLRGGLDTGSLIYFRSYAVNGTGTGYGPDNSFYTEPAASPLSATQLRVSHPMQKLP